MREELTEGLLRVYPTLTAGKQRQRPPGWRFLLGGVEELAPPAGYRLGPISFLLALLARAARRSSSSASRSMPLLARNFARPCQR